MSRELEQAYAIQKEMAMQKDRDILTHVKEYPGTFEGLDDIYKLSRNFQWSLINRPDKPHVMLFAGEPVSGKTTILYGLLNELLKENGPIQNFAQSKHYRIQLDILPWGDPFPILEEKGLKFPGGLRYFNRPKLLKRKREELWAAEGLYSHALNQTIDGFFFKNQAGERTDEKILHIIVGDVPGITGVRDLEVGAARADVMLQQLQARTGQFNGLNFELFVAGVVASDIVRERNKKSRLKMLEQETAEKKREALLSQGIHIDTVDDEVLQSYSKEVAPLADVKQIEDDVNSLILYLYAYDDEIIDLDGRFRITSSVANIRPFLHDRGLPRSLRTTLGPFGFNSDDRTRVIGQGIMPYFLHHRWKIPPNRRMIIYNHTPLEEIDMFLHFAHDRRVKQLYRAGPEYRQELA